MIQVFGIRLFGLRVEDEDRFSNLICTGSRKPSEDLLVAIAGLIIINGIKESLLTHLLVTE